jgi:hypothetical protein
MGRPPLSIDIASKDQRELARLLHAGQPEPAARHRSSTTHPTHGSWLNQAEIEIGILSRQCLGHRRIPDLKPLRREAKAWNRRMNRDRVMITWKFDRKAAGSSAINANLLTGQ